MTRAMTVRVFQQENTTKLRQHHASDTPSVKHSRWRPVWMQREPERAHTRHTPDVCAHSDHLDMVVYKR